MKQIIKQKLRKRLSVRNFTRRFVYNPKWENCDYWRDYSDSERQAILREQHAEQKKEKLFNLARYVDVDDFEYFYKTNHAFRAFVDKIERKKK